MSTVHRPFFQCRQPKEKITFGKQCYRAAYQKTTRDGLKRHTCGGHGLVWKDVSPKGNGLLGVLLMFTLPVNTGKQNQAEQKSVDKAPLTGEG